MEVTIYPSLCHGEVHIPPSKSMTHRALICAALANGTSTIHNVLRCEDTMATLQAIKQLGATIQWKDQTTLSITGTIASLSQTSSHISCKESGSTLRFLIPLCSLFFEETFFEGEGRLMQRPLSVYEEIFQKQGISFQKNQNSLSIKGQLQADHFHIKGNISSQFITGLFFALPLLKQDSLITIEPPIESKSYISMTLHILKQYGILIHQIAENTWEIKGNQVYKACDWTIEGDYSQFAFFAVLAAINQDLHIKQVAHHSLQGDAVILNILKEAHTSITSTEEGFFIRKSKLAPFQVDIHDCPDLGPILMVLAAYAQGTSKITNASRLRLKESDRIEAMETELKKLGVNIHSSIDEITIVGNPPYQANTPLSSHHDHRIAMSLAILATMTKQACTIQDAQAIQKSYPQFFQHLKDIHIQIEEN